MDFDVAVDCRWLGLWGAGRITQLLLSGLAEDPPAGEAWALWGRPGSVARYATWPGAVVVADESDPRRWRGQDGWFRVPKASVTLFGHQRPLRPVPAVTWIFDTISLRHGGTAVGRRARRVYWRRVSALSHTVLTISEHSRTSIVRDLGVDPAHVTVVTPPVDWTRADRIRAQRAAATLVPPTAVYTGWFAPHKNVDRLIEAFGRTVFRAGGGRLVLVGGTPEDVARVSSALSGDQRRSIDVRGRVGDEDLDAVMAAATLVVQPSLEEGFGLPVAEALAAGIPVCVSDGGALPEVVGPMATPFRATSVDAMAAAIDATAHDAESTDPETLVAYARDRFPTVAQFARSVRDALEESKG